jgi:hypothetical protein
MRRDRRQQLTRGGAVEGGVKPGLPCPAAGEDDRHAVVDRPHQLVRRAGDDRATRDPPHRRAMSSASRTRRSRTARRRRARSEAAAGAGAGPPVAATHTSRPSRSGSGYSTARPALGRPASPRESRRARVDHREARLELLGPVRHEPPAQLLDPPAVAILNDGQHLLRGRDVETLEGAVRRRRLDTRLSVSQARISSHDQRAYERCLSGELNCRGERRCGRPGAAAPRAAVGTRRVGNRIARIRDG